MSNSQVALVGTGNKEVEEESTEETTLTEISKNLGHTKSLERTAQFECNETKTITDDTSVKNIERSANAVQSVTKSVSQVGQVTSTKTSTSHSYSVEESEEYECEEEC